MHLKKFQRDEAILLSLKKLDYLSRKQLQCLHNLSGERNARRVLSGLCDYISSFRSKTGESIYYLNRLGRERVACDVVRQKIGQQVGHFLMRNDIYVHYKPEDWKNEVKVKVDDILTIIPDAYFRHDLKRHFLEVDHLQHMNKNREKIERYKKLKATGTFQNNLKYFPPLVWVTLTESRKKQLLDWCEGLEVTVHLWDDIK